MNKRVSVVIIVVLILIGLIAIALYRNCHRQNGLVTSKGNLSVAQQKLSTDLLQLTDNRYLPSGMTKEMLEQQMEQNHQFTYIPGTENAIVYVYIRTGENADLAQINSSVWNITNIDPEDHLVVAWVNVKNLTELASYDFIRSIQSVYPPVTMRNTGS